VEGVYLAVFGKSISLNARVNRRLSMLEQGASREDVLEQLRKEMGQHKGRVRVPFYSLIADKAQKANIAFSPEQLIMVMMGLTAVVFLALTILTSASLPIRALVSVVMGVGGVYQWVASKAKKRIAKLEEQLPDAVELMVRSLRVGHPFVSACTRSRARCRTRWLRAGDHRRRGRLWPRRVGIDPGHGRTPGHPGLALPRGCGGHPADLGRQPRRDPQGLANVIRARFKLFRKVKAITSEAKFSGTFLSFFPILCLIGINVMQPDYYSEVIDTPAFIPACAVVAVMLAVNMIFMRMMVNIKV
jgi:tight adherence protein B